MTQDPEFAESHGITNGAAWYPVYGGLQVDLEMFRAVWRVLHNPCARACRLLPLFPTPPVRLHNRLVPNNRQQTL